jgi:flagellar basal-body rod protein FlgB
MFLQDLTNRGAAPALLNTLTFAESHHRMLAENIANWNVPGYKSKTLDTNAFQKQLRNALDKKGSDPSAPFVLEGNKQFQTQKDGTLKVTPDVQPVQNVLFHDGTNGSIETWMSSLSKNAMLYETATTLLKNSFEGVKKAIRGQM